QGGGFLNAVLENLVGGDEPEYGSRPSGGSYDSTARSAGGMSRTRGTSRESSKGGSTAGAGTSTARPPSHQEY
ncbi:MAG TPA: hypothetical protein VFR37_13475, partial [Longimicrobium sp.]|nr:hypothetical protein [Longimicrobium sp.]